MMIDLIKLVSRSHHAESITSVGLINEERERERERSLKVGEIPREKEEAAAITMIRSEKLQPPWNVKVGDRWESPPYSSPSRLDHVSVSLFVSLLSRLTLICQKTFSAFYIRYVVFFLHSWKYLIFFFLIYLFGSSDHGRVGVAAISYGNLKFRFLFI